MMQFIAVQKILLVSLVVTLFTNAAELFAEATPAPMIPIGLTCEYLTDPIGIDVTKPRLSWALESSERAQLQSAYQILVASSLDQLKENVGDKWDNGKVKSDTTIHIEYAGKSLKSGERCYWKVRVWDANGKASPYSSPAIFEMGLLTANDWKAKWISRSEPKYIDGRIGKAIELNGKSQTIQLPAYKDKFKNQITISAWIKIPSAPAGWAEIYRKDDGNARRLLAVGTERDAFHIWFGLGIDGKHKQFDAVVDEKQVVNDKWHLITGIYDGTEAQIYLDANSVLQTPQKGKIDVQGNAVPYAGSFDGTREFFPGAIDDLRIYDRALLATEVEALVNHTDQNSLKDNLIQHWTFDDHLYGNAVGQSGWWIDNKDSAAPLLRKEFMANKPIRKARAYISGLGYSELYVNGGKIGDHVLDPPSSNYKFDPSYKLKDRVHYVTYDVTKQLKSGSNALGVMLGNGWFSDDTPNHLGRFPWAARPQLLFQLQIEYDDGTQETIVSDTSWKTAAGPIKANEICNGETYDGRDEQVGWSSPGFQDSSWQAAILAPELSHNMSVAMMPPCRVVATIPAVSVKELKPGVWIFDFGQHFSGWTQLHVRGDRGTKVTLRHAGVLYPSGELDLRANLHAALIDHYTLNGGSDGKGNSEEIWEPRFTLHGFRYVEMTGFPGKPTLDTLFGRQVRNDVPIISEFESSNPLINKIYSNNVWTLATSFQNLPQDAAERDERVGWQGDPGFVAEDYMVDFNAASFWANWLRDLQDVQKDDGHMAIISPLHRGFPPNADWRRQYYDDNDWLCTYPIFIHYLYEYHRDERLIAEHYPTLVKLIDFFQSQSPNHLLPTTLGDHMEPQINGSVSFRPTKSNSILTATCYYYRVAKIQAELANILHKPDDVKKYEKLASDIKRDFNAKFFDTKKKCYGSNSQTENSVPLEMDIVPEEYREAVAQNIVDNIQNEYKGHLGTGIIGTTSLTQVLPKMGRSDVMFTVASQKTFPGWGHQIERGATTVWETWNGDPGRNWNMKMFASASKFFIKNLGGIQCAAPGYQRAVFKPEIVGDLTHVRAAQNSSSGRYSIEWNADKNKKIKDLEVRVPAGSTASVNVPVSENSNVTIKEDGRIVWRKGQFQSGDTGVVSGRKGERAIIFEIGSGKYHFNVGFDDEMLQN